MTRLASVALLASTPAWADSMEPLPVADENTIMLIGAGVALLVAVRACFMLVMLVRAYRRHTPVWLTRTYVAKAARLRR